MRNYSVLIPVVCVLLVSCASYNGQKHYAINTINEETYYETDSLHKQSNSIERHYSSRGAKPTSVGPILQTSLIQVSNTQQKPRYLVVKTGKEKKVRFERAKQTTSDIRKANQSSSHSKELKKTKRLLIVFSILAIMALTIVLAGLVFGIGFLYFYAISATKSTLELFFILMWFCITVVPGLVLADMTLSDKKQLSLKYKQLQKEEQMREEEQLRGENQECN